MNLRELLEQRKSSILKKWVHAVFENYPADSSNFFLKQKDQFLNPIGHTISEGTISIFDELVQGAEIEKFYPILTDIIKINAVQDVAPSQAVAFLFFLKGVIKKEAGDVVRKQDLTEELTAFEARIDQLILLSFDIYVKCKESIYDLKNDHMRRMTFRLLRKANIVYDLEEAESSPGDEKVLTQK